MARAHQRRLELTHRRRAAGLAHALAPIGTEAKPPADCLARETVEAVNKGARA